jgi:K+ transporter
VLSALEGLKDPLPSFAPYVLPLSVLVLTALFALQPQGTARIGALFGPIMAIWFITIGAAARGHRQHPARAAASAAEAHRSRRQFLHHHRRIWIHATSERAARTVPSRSARPQTSFFVGRVKIMAAKVSALGRFRCRISELMHRNALAATDFFRIPPNRVIELGSQTQI